MRRGGKILSLQVLRAIAFMMIFVSHAFGRFIDLGALGVSIFVILSGFCMMISYKERDLPLKLRDRVLFSVRKMKKLYPLHILTLVVALCFIGISGWTTVVDFVLDVLLVQAWVPSAAFSINGVAWYLSLSIFLYFMFPLIKVRIISETDKKNLIWIAVAVFVVQIWIGYAASLLGIGGVDAKWVTYIWPVYRLGDFVIGCILGALFSSHNKILRRRVSSTFAELGVFAILAGVELLLLKNFEPLNNVWCRYNIIYIPFSVALVYLFAQKNGLVTRILTNKVVVFVGNISGYAFLIHTIVLYYLSPFLFQSIWGDVPRLLQVIISFALTIVISVIYMKCDMAVRTFLEKQKKSVLTRKNR